MSFGLCRLISITIECISVVLCSWDFILVSMGYSDTKSRFSVWYQCKLKKKNQRFVKRNGVLILYIVPPSPCYGVCVRSCWGRSMSFYVSPSKRYAHCSLLSCLRLRCWLVRFCVPRTPPRYRLRARVVAVQILALSAGRRARTYSVLRRRLTTGACARALAHSSVTTVTRRTAHI